jgi:glycosyltransferase involved in cell wall biosynthesis/peptidoglycan/xylan/chitin deacetylase (PgdA/CDA1 family)
MERIRILQFMTTFEYGGTEGQFAETVARLDRSRFDVRVACFHRSGPLLDFCAEHATEVVEFPIRSFHDASVWRELRHFVAYCRRARIDILHTHDLYANVFGLIGGAWARVPVRIGSRRDINPDKTAGQIALQRLSYAAAHRIVANSGAAVHRLVSVEHVPSERVILIPNGLNLTQYSPRRAPDGATLAVIAGIRPGKGHDTLMRAAPAVFAARPDARILMLGDGPLRPALEAEAERLGLADRILFLGWRDDIPAILESVDVVVHPSDSEALPNAVIEGMASARPVVATAVGGVPELITSGENGLLVPPRDPAALADAILSVLADPARAIEFGQRGRALVAARFSFERTIAAFEQLYVREFERRSARASITSTAAPERPYGSSDATLPQRARGRLKKASFGLARSTGALGLMRRALRGQARILMYHGVIADGERADINRLHLPASEFERQMQFLCASFRVIPLRDLVAACHGELALPPDAAAITFDDGYANNHEVAAPILERYGLSATVFLTVNYIGTDQLLWHDEVERTVRFAAPGSYRVPWLDTDLVLTSRADRRRALGIVIGRLARLGDEHRWELIEKLQRTVGVSNLPREFSRKLMSWAQAQDLARRGWDIGSHTLSHAVVTTLEPARLEAEIVGSGQRIEAAIGRPAQLFAYPNGGAADFDEAAKRQLRQARYTGAVTTMIGLNTSRTDPFALHRVPVMAGDDFVTFQANVSGVAAVLGWQQAHRKSSPHPVSPVAPAA